MNKLIEGGIYTVSNVDDIYYVFLKEDNTHFWFYRQQSNPSGRIQDWLNNSINNNIKEYLFNDVIQMKPEKFQKKVDGFLGTIKPGKLNVLFEILDAKL